MAGIPRLQGIGFSGGGIRSASFASGVLSYLMDDALPLPEGDYQHEQNHEDAPQVLPELYACLPEHISTVSGGGFTGAGFFSTFLRCPQIPDDQWDYSGLSEQQKHQLGSCQNGLNK